MPRKKGVLYGVTKPRIFTPPLRRLTRKTTLGFDAIDFAQNVLGIDPYPWQKDFLKRALEILPNGDPRFRTIILMAARQQGKTEIIKILTLWKMYEQGAVLTLGTAQKLDDAEEVWKEVLAAVEDNPFLNAEVNQVIRKNGSTEFNLVTGERYKVAAANRKGGRGRSVDGFVVIDELREQTDWQAWSALTKTTMAKRSGQVIAMSNAGDSASVVLRTLRERQLKAIEEGTSKSVGWFEFSAPDDCEIDDREAWAYANPSCGYSEGLTEEVIEAAMESDPEPEFRMEVLCQWWTRAASSMFPGESWMQKMDPDSSFTDDSPLVLAVSAWQKEGTIGRASICAAGVRDDGDFHVEVISSRPGLDWVVDRIVELYESSAADAVAIQSRGAVASRWIPDLRDRGVNVLEFGGGEIAIAHGSFYQAVIAGPGEGVERVWHIGQENLTLAANEAQPKVLGGQWVFDLNHEVVDVTPLVGCAEALFGLKSTLTREQRRSAYESSGLVVV